MTRRRRCGLFPWLPRAVALMLAALLLLFEMRGASSFLLLPPAPATTNRIIFGATGTGRHRRRRRHQNRVVIGGLRSSGRRRREGPPLQAASRPLRNSTAAEEEGAGGVDRNGPSLLLPQQEPIVSSSAKNNFRALVRKIGAALEQRNLGHLLQVVNDDGVEDRSAVVRNCVEVNSLVFQVTCSSSGESAAGDDEPPPYILVVLPSHCRVDEGALLEAVAAQQQCCSHRRSDGVVESIRLVPPDRVRGACGFEPGSVPPLGLAPPPAATVLDESLFVLARAAREDAEDDLFLLGGGGEERGSCLIALRILQMHATNVVRWNVAVRGTGRAGLETDLPQTEKALRMKPFFPIEPPNDAVASAVLSGDEKSLQQTENPLQQAEEVQVVGRIAAVRRMARRLVFCDFVPVDGTGGGWRSGADGRDMAVQLIAGRTLCENLGEEEAVAALRQLQTGQLVLVRGRINASSRDSLRNWVTKRTLDMIVLNYQLLSVEKPGREKPAFKNQAASFLIKQQQRRSVTPSEPSVEAFLRLHELYPSTNNTVVVVDSQESVAQFERNLLRITIQGIKGTGRIGLVGIDCEWRPRTMLTSSSDPQPVLLLQVCLHPAKKVYLFDLQTLLRSLLPVDELMNAMETKTGNALRLLFRSQHLIKVGFQVNQDLSRLAASYPHMESVFSEVQSVLEASILGRKVMRLTRDRNARFVTSSLSRLSEHVMGLSINKDAQCSDWALRPLTAQQVDYAALDAAVTPAIIEKLIESVGAGLFWVHENDGRGKPQLGRWRDDRSFARMITSFKFHLFPPDVFDDGEDWTMYTKKLQAKRLVGDELVVTQNWIAGDEQPLQPTPLNEGSYIHNDGIVRVPSQTVSMSAGGLEKTIGALAGHRAGKSKDKCVAMFLNLPDAVLEYPQRSGFIEFQDGLVLFVNLPNKPGYGQPRSFPNEWLENGKILTWFLRANDWQDGDSDVARKLIPMNGSDPSPTVVLFVRMGKGPFLCCGRCRVEECGGCGSPGAGSFDYSNLVKFNLHLLDWKKLRRMDDFQEMLCPGGCSTSLWD